MKKLLTILFSLSLLILAPYSFAQQTSVKPAAPANSKSMSEEEKVDYLINYLRHLDGAVFIRNGKEYSPDKAADHLNSKWEKHKKRVKTAQGFVTRLASVSKSDEPYQIRFNDGRTIKCGELLAEELKKIEK